MVQKILFSYFRVILINGNISIAKDLFLFSNQILHSRLLQIEPFHILRVNRHSIENISNQLNNLDLLVLFYSPLVLQIYYDKLSSVFLEKIPYLKNGFNKESALNEPMGINKDSFFEPESKIKISHSHCQLLIN